MSRCRALVAVLSLALILPSAAFAQGAGDEQYQDPFGDEQTQQQPPGGDDGLTDEPPGGGGGGGNGGGGNTGPAPEDPAPRPGEDRALPNTGSDPRILAFAGLLLVLIGVGLRLRTIDPDAY